MVDRLTELKLGAKLIDHDILLPNKSYQTNLFKMVEEITNDLKLVNTDLINPNDFDISRTQLIAIKEKINLLEKEKVPPHYTKMKNNLIESVKGKLKDKITIINNKKILLNEQIKNEAIRKIKNISPYISDNDLESIYKYPDEYIKESICLSSIDSKLIITNILKDIKSKHSDIVMLESQIKELYDLYVDFAVIVEKQGEMMDNIENHILLANDNVELANNELVESIIIKKSIFKKQCCLFSIFLIIVIIIIAIILILSYQNK